MRLTEQEKSLLALFKKIEGERGRNDLLFQAETMVRAQDAMKNDYGLAGPDASLFNGPRAAAPGPVMEAQV
jgi:hypothetical protein